MSANEGCLHNGLAQYLHVVLTPLAIENTYTQLRRELQWKPSTTTQLLIKCSLLLLGLSHNMPDGFPTQFRLRQMPSGNSC